jgi:hypothetical protein
MILLPLESSYQDELNDSKIIWIWLLNLEKILLHKFVNNYRII